MKLRKRNHATAEAARTELVRAGYWPLCQAPGSDVQLWTELGDTRSKRKRDRLAGPLYAIGCERRSRSQVFHIVRWPS